MRTARYLRGVIEDALVDDSSRWGVVGELSTGKQEHVGGVAELDMNFGRFEQWQAIYLREAVGTDGSTSGETGGSGSAAMDGGLGG